MLHSMVFECKCLPFSLPGSSLSLFHLASPFLSFSSHLSLPLFFCCPSPLPFFSLPVFVSVPLILFPLFLPLSECVSIATVYFSFVSIGSCRRQFIDIQRRRQTFPYIKHPSVISIISCWHLKFIFLSLLQILSPFVFDSTVFPTDRRCVHIW